MANLDKFNDLRKTFFIIYSDIKLNILKHNVDENINENNLSDLYSKLNIFYEKLNKIKNNNILLQGFIDNEVLLDFQNYQISGGLYKTEVIKENGNLKENIKLTFGYEFLLRLTYNSVRIMTIPKIGYKHMSMREGSIFWGYKNGESIISNGEVKFWISTAKKEYFFSNDRNIKYEGQSA